MLTIESETRVPGLAGTDVVDFLLRCDDASYRRWWPGTHLRLHTVEGRRGEIGSVIHMDEYVGRRRVKMTGVLEELVPGERVVWRWKAPVPASLTLELADEPGGVHITHVIRAGFSGTLAVLDPLLRRYLDASFERAMDDHVKTEFAKLGQLLAQPQDHRPMPTDDGHLWDRIARRYELIVRPLARSYEAIRERLLRDVSGGDRVLEVAAGTGQLTVTLARTAGSLVATDASEAMVGELDRALREAGVAGVTTRVADVYALPFTGETFDVVVAANVLHVIEHPDRALAEIRRVLVPGGRVVVPTFCHGASRRARLLSRALSVVSPFVAHHRFDADGLSRLVTDAGFVVERRERLDGLFPSVYVLARRAGG